MEDQETAGRVMAADNITAAVHSASHVIQSASWLQQVQVAAIQQERSPVVQIKYLAHDQA
jgi:hypothetical protein